MGMFPYNCDICRGGDFKCGRPAGECSPNCKGGQTCWEDSVVIVLVKNDSKHKIEGTYNGSGGVLVNLDTQIPNDNWTWEEFGLLFLKEKYYSTNLGHYTQNIIDITNIISEKTKPVYSLIYCESCYTEE